jgi:hypothetical protein
LCRTSEKYSIPYSPAVLVSIASDCCEDPDSTDTEELVELLPLSIEEGEDEDEHRDGAADDEHGAAAAATAAVATATEADADAEGRAEGVIPPEAAAGEAHVLSSPVVARGGSAVGVGRRVLPDEPAAMAMVCAAARVAGLMYIVCVLPAVDRVDKVDEEVEWDAAADEVDAGVVAEVVAAGKDGWVPPEGLTSPPARSGLLPSSALAEVTGEGGVGSAEGLAEELRREAGELVAVLVSVAELVRAPVAERELRVREEPVERSVLLRVLNVVRATLAGGGGKVCRGGGRWGGSM